MSDINEEETDQTEYEYSEEKYNKLIRQMAIDPEIIKKGKESEAESEVNYKEETIRQLAIYIRNYDKDGNLVENPVNAIKTCIDTFEKEKIKTTWITDEYVMKEDGTQELRQVTHVEYSDSSDDSIFAEEEVLKVEPQYIDSTYFVYSFLRQYLKNFNINKNKGGKTLYIEFHMTKDDSNFYDISYDDISYFINKNYDIIGLNLDNRNLIIDSDKVIELTTLSLENLNLQIKSDTGFNVKAKNVYIESIKIDSYFKDHLGCISLSISNEVKITYIDFIRDICKFDLLNTNRSDMLEWMKTSIDIYGIDFIKDDAEYKYPIESIFKIDGFYNVKINGINIYGNELNMNLMKFINDTNVNLGTFNITFNKFDKHILVFEKVTNLTCCGIYFTQKFTPEKDVYSLYMSNSMIMGEIKFSSFITENVGLLSLLNNASAQISLYNAKCVNFNKPIKWIGNSIGKFIISNCNFENITEFDINVPNLSIFDSRISNVVTFNTTTGEKLFISNASISGDNLMIAITDDSNALIDSSKVSFKDIKYIGKEGTGNIKNEKCIIISDILSIQGMNRLSSENTEYEIKKIDITANNINKFNPSFTKSKIKEIEIKGNIKNSLLFISDSIKNRIKYKFDMCKGNVNLFYDKEISDIDLNINNSVIDITVDTNKEKDIESKIKFSYLNECIGSTLTSFNENIKFSPQAEGAFKDLLFFNDPEVNLKKGEWKEKISYGYKIEK